MRLLVLSIGFSVLLLGAAWAQSSGGGQTLQLPVGQTFKNFVFPVYEGGKLRYTGNATQATGITQNRAEATELKIQVYDNGAVTTTITSPKADLYVNERKMRTKNTVDIERANMSATAQSCDFDMTTSKYLLRTNVRVVLKNFDVGKSTSLGDTSTPSTSSSTPSVAAPSVPSPAPSVPVSNPNNESMLDMPGAVSSTNAAPQAPSDTK